MVVHYNLDVVTYSWSSLFANSDILWIHLLKLIGYAQIHAPSAFLDMHRSMKKLSDWPIQTWLHKDWRSIDSQDLLKTNNNIVFCSFIRAIC